MKCIESLAFVWNPKDVHGVTRISKESTGFVIEYVGFYIICICFCVMKSIRRYWNEGGLTGMN